MRFLIDTNVLSEAGRRSAIHPEVENFLRRVHQLSISVVSIHEITYGIELLPNGLKREELTVSMQRVLSGLKQQILSVGEDEAKRAALIRADARKRGRVLHLSDALIAATAYEHRLALATRNVSDFEGLGIEVVNPWNG